MAISKTENFDNQEVFILGDLNMDSRRSTLGTRAAKIKIKLFFNFNFCGSGTQGIEGVTLMGSSATGNSANFTDLSNQSKKQHA